MICTRCGGRGRRNHGLMGMTTCARCNGTGQCNTPKRLSPRDLNAHIPLSTPRNTVEVKIKDRELEFVEDEDDKSKFWLHREPKWGMGI